jgi:hypothetical protein
MNVTLRYDMQMNMYHSIIYKILRFEHSDNEIISYIQETITNGFDINFKDNEENNILCCACSLHRENIIKFILKHQNFWPYHLDIHFNHVWGILCKYDLEDIFLWYVHEVKPLRTEDINMVNIYSENLFVISCFMGKKRIILECLKNRYFKIHQMNRFQYDGFMYCLVSSHHMKDIIKEIMKHPNFNINHIFPNKKMYIHLMERCFHENINIHIYIYHLKEIWNVNDIDIELWKIKCLEITNKYIKKHIFEYEKKRALRRISIFYKEFMYHMYHPSRCHFYIDSQKIGLDGSPY